MLVVSIASKAGSAAPAEPDEPSATRKYRPAASEPDKVVGCQLVDDADAYCTVQPVRSTVLDERFSSSTKSFA
jgi:hypothetical protein